MPLIFYIDMALPTSHLYFVMSFKPEINREAR